MMLLVSLILKLMLKDDFPRIRVLSWENRDLRQLLWHRHRMVQNLPNFCLSFSRLPYPAKLDLPSARKILNCRYQPVCVNNPDLPRSPDHHCFNVWTPVRAPRLEV